MSEIRSKFEINLLAEDLARIALDWIEAALLDGDFGVSYALEHNDLDVRIVAELLAEELRRRMP